MSLAADLTHSIDLVLEEAYAVDGPGAVALLVKDGQTLYRRAIGLANLEFAVPLAPEMVFQVASLTKPFTAQATLLLAEAGKLTLTDSVTRYLPDCAALAPITLEHLLTHTAGLVNYVELPEWWAIHRQDVTVVELMALFKDRPLLSAPGARWAYNNSGYVLLGAVIEAVSGQPYAQFVGERLLAPLGLHRSGFFPAGQVLSGCVNGYQMVDGTCQKAEYLSLTQAYAAGALLSTADDLARWGVALFAGQVLQPATLERALSAYRLNDGTLAPYGYGWFIAQGHGRQLVEHLGSLPGFAHYVIGVPAERLWAIVLTNRASQNTVPDKLARQMIALALDQTDRQYATR
jgi:D-alanyl-D-alanine carboxypeptidase